MPDIPKLNADEDPDEEPADVTRLGAVEQPAAVEIPLHGYLTVLVGEEPGRVISLDAPSSIIGRGADCGIRLEGDGVSRNHAKISRQSGKYTVEDLGSTNGTWIDGAPASPEPLRSGSRIRIGTHVTVRFNLYDEEEAALQRRLFENVIQDTLTGAYNRRFFERSLGNEATQANRLATPLAVLALQIDEIRRIADYYTQAGADALLSRVVKLAHEAVRPEDIVGRIAPDEFGVIIRGMARADVAQIAEEMRRRVEALEFLWQSGDFSMNIEQITASVAVAMLEDVAATPTADALIGEIAKRLRAARAQGGNIVVGAP